MKKVLLILLALLVVTGGVVFANDDPVPGGPATLKLEAAPITHVLKHGFLNEAVPNATFASITGALSDTYDDDLTYKTFGLETNDLNNMADGIAFYYFATNTASSAYKVYFLVKPFEKNGTSVKVPWTLTIDKLVSNAGTFAENVTYITTPGLIGGLVDSSANTLIFTASGSLGLDSEGDPLAPVVLPSYLGLKLGAYTDADANKNYGLPASADNNDVFIAEVIASVTTL